MSVKAEGANTVKGEEMSPDLTDFINRVDRKQARAT
jgi:hypothetical protein